MRKTVLSLLCALSLLLTLTSCGKEPEAAQSPQSVLEAAGGLSAEETLLTVDGREVAAWQYLYWLAEVTDGIRSYYEGAQKPLDWSEPLEDGTLGDYAKDQALKSAALYATVETWAQRCGCALTEADRSAIAADWAARVKENGGEESYLTLLAQKGLDRAGAEHLAQVQYLYLKLCQLAARPDGPLWAGEEELAAFFQDSGYLTVDLILVPKTAGADASALDTCRQKAAGLFSQLNQSGDVTADFAALRAGTAVAAQYPKTLLPGDGTLPEPFAQAAAGLSPGQLSGILEAEEGYGILLRLPDDPQAVRQDFLDRQLQTEAETAPVEVTERYQALDTAAFCAELDQARAALRRTP